MLFVVLLYELIYCHWHRRCSRRWSFNIETKTSIVNGLCGGGTEATDNLLALNEVREILAKRCNSLRAEEDERIKIVGVDVRKIATYGVVEECFRVGQAISVERVEVFLLMDIAERKEEFLLFVLLEQLEQFWKFTRTMENLALAVYYKLLQVKCNLFRNAEIVHSIGH